MTPALFFGFILLGISIGVIIGMFVGMYIERVRWNNLIQRGVLPKPRSAR